MLLFSGLSKWLFGELNLILPFWESLFVFSSLLIYFFMRSSKYVFYLIYFEMRYEINETEKIEEMINGCKPWYQRAASSIGDVVKQGAKNKYVRAGVTGAGVGALMLTGSAYAGDGNIGESYGFFSGMWDGFFWQIDLFLDIVGDSTIASDGNGVISEPNTGPGYYIGFLMTGGAEGLFIGGLFGGNE